MENTAKLIRSYLSLTGALLVAGQVKGQVVYYDFNPDTVLAAPNSCNFVYLDLDLNNDSVMDFRVRARKCYPGTTYGCNGEFIEIAPTPGNQIVPGYYGCPTGLSYNPNNPQALKLTNGDTIGNASPFSNDGMLRQWAACTFQSYLLDCGTWATGNIASVGLKFKIAGQFHYGWLRLQMLSKSACKLLDYAYQDQAGAPVSAGSTIDLTTSIQEIIPEITLTVNDKNVELVSKTFLNSADVTVVDLLGAVVWKSTWNGSNMHFSLKTQGMYVVQINGNQVRYKKKFFIY
ncbi:MAG TPA: T9SS type A sorting domain-containing protein [Bacteroidia bacterium]|nr:T9SS type A sorting domain-containing protein [Bacteroidia bacterium]